MPANVATPGPVPREALDYFRDKGLKVSFDYRDTWREEHASAFTVAKAMQVDVLTSIRAELERAIAEGRTLQQFQRELTPTLQRLGWWGKQEMVDESTGEIVNAQLGSPRRLRTIYNANLRTARAAGQWQRIERTKDALPFLLRTLGPSREHRPEHVEWHGTLLPVDAPFWETHMPPDGWECKCRVRQVSRVEAERLKAKGVLAADRKQIKDPETGLPTGHLEQRYTPVKTTAPQIRHRDWLNKRTGAVERVPAGIDPGWDTNPGKVRQKNLENLLAGKLGAAPRPVTDAAVRDLVASGRYQAWVDDVLAFGQPRGQAQIVGAIDAEVESFIREKGVTLDTPVIDVSDRTLLHGRRDQKSDRGAALSDEDLRQLPLRLLEADPRWDSQDPALIYFFDAVDERGRKGKAVVRVNFREKGEVANRVKTTGLVKPANMDDPRYEKIPRKGI